jgi:hypothetical protein
MSGEPRLGRPPQPPPLLGGDHLQWVTERLRTLALDLAEDEPVAAAHDQVELVPARPDVRREDPVPAQAVVQRGTPLEPPPDPGGAQAADAGS